jgi:geranylgeranyl pyrophosphate synthase
MQAWGLVVLLLSKAAGHLNVDSSADEDECGVLRSQRALAEIAEMIRTSHRMHNSLINIRPGLFSEPVVHNSMSFGNKVALLSGDYLLANSYNELSALKNPNVSRALKTVLIRVYCSGAKEYSMLGGVLCGHLFPSDWKILEKPLKRRWLQFSRARLKIMYIL